VPAFFVPTGFQYAIETYRDGFIVTDGHHNRVLYVTLDGEITEVVAFADVVPTGLAVRGNTIYVTQAGPIPHLPENAKLMSFSPGVADRNGSGLRRRVGMSGYSSTWNLAAEVHSIRSHRASGMVL
jgi:hypothetical protein